MTREVTDIFTVALTLFRKDLHSDQYSALAERFAAFWADQEFSAAGK